MHWDTSMWTLRRAWSLGKCKNVCPYSDDGIAVTLQEITHLSERDRSQEAWGAAGDGHRQEGGVHGPDVGSPAGKQVVGVEVEQHDDGEGLLPCQAVAGHHIHHLRRIQQSSEKYAQNPIEGSSSCACQHCTGMQER